MLHNILAVLVWLVDDPRVAIKIGNIEVRWYGLIIATGALLAAILASRLARYKNIASDHIWQIFPWVLVGGIIGARLGFALVAPAGTFSSPLEALNPFSGGFAGLAIQGGLVGGFIAAYIYCRLNKLSIFALADVAMPGVALAQAIGRLGNFANQEAYGEPCTHGEFYCIPIDQQFRRRGFEQYQYFQPTFAYELVWNLLNFAVLLYLIQPKQQKRFGLRDGDIFWLYLIIYSIGRFVIEGIRIDSQFVAGFKGPQLFAIVAIVFGGIAIAVNHSRRPGRTQLATSAGPLDAGDLEVADEATVDTAGVADLPETSEDELADEARVEAQDDTARADTLAEKLSQEDDAPAPTHLDETETERKSLSASSRQ